MAEENTTDSTPNPTPDPNPGKEASNTSTTDPKPEPSPAPDDGPTPGTILTDPADAPAADPTADPSADPKSDPEPPSEFLGAPEGDYELSGLPEGTAIDEKAMEAITPVAKELNLSNVGLSKIAMVYDEKILPQVVDGLTDNLQREVAAQHAAWAQQATDLVKTDPVFEGRPLSEVQSIAAKAIDRFGGEAFRTFLQDTGLGNHPDMVKFAYMTGSAISEDTSFERGVQAPKPKSITEKFYGPQS